MKPILYSSNETSFKSLGLGVLRDEINTLITEERNGEFYLEMEYPITGIHFTKIKTGRWIKADASPDQPAQRFKIMRISKPAKGTVKLYAEHARYLALDYQLRPQSGYSGAGIDLLRAWDRSLVERDTNPFTFFSDVQTKATGVWEVQDFENAGQALGGAEGSILDRIGGEYKFDNYHISLFQSRGRDEGIPIMYGKNIVDLEQEEEIVSMYNSVFPYATYTPETVDGIEYEPVTLTLPEYYVDSFPEGAVERRPIKMDFSSYKTASGEEITTVADLRDITNQFINDNDIGSPKVNIKLEIIDLAQTLDYKDIAQIEELRLCDWVNVYFHKLGINRKAKIVKTVYNPTTRRFKELHVGDIRATLSDRINATVDDKVEEVQGQLNIIQAHANGKNRIFRGPDEPTQNLQKGDLWFKVLGENEYEMYIYDGETWGNPVVTTGINQELQDALEEARDAIQDARDEAIDIDKKADDILTGLGIEGLETTHQNIVDGIQSAVGGRFDSIDGVVTGLGDRLDNISGEITGDFATENYVDQSINYERGEINTVIAGITNSPEENILGYNIVKQTASGNASEIGMIKSSPSSRITGYQSLLETADQYRRVIGSTTETDGQIKQNIARLVMAEDIFQTTISSSVTDGLSGFEISDRNLVKNSSLIKVSSSASGISYSIISDQYLRVDVSPDNSNWMVLNIDVEDEHFKHGDEYTVSFEIKSLRGSKLPPKFMVNSSSGYKQVKGMATNEFTQVSYTGKWNTGGTTTYRFGWGDTSGLFHIKNLKIQKSSKATPWTPAIEDTEGKLEVLSTTVTQLAGSWALQIEDGEDIVTELNATRRGIHLKGALITLDGDTITDNFTVTNKMIANNIEADKITTGTLNGGTVNIINVNAQNIVGENANLIRASFNAGQDNTQIDGSGIHMLGSGTWRRTYLTATGFDLYNGQGGSGKAGVIGYFKEHGDSASSSENFISSTKGSSHYIGMAVNPTHHIVLGWQEYTALSNRYYPVIEIDGYEGIIRFYRPITSAGSNYRMRVTAYDGDYSMYGVGFTSDNAGIIFANGGTYIWKHSTQAWVRF